MFYSVMEPHWPFSNSIVKRYSGEDTERVAFWENNTVSKFLLLIYDKNSLFCIIVRNSLSFCKPLNN